MRLGKNHLKNVREFWIPTWLKRCMEEDYDRLIIIFGKEGVGKSTLALILANMIYEERKKKYGIDAKFEPKKNIHYDIKSLRKEILNESQPGDVQILDEAVTIGGFRREAMTKQNRQLIKTFMTCRSKNNIILVLVPNASALEKDFKRRANSIFRVVGRGHAWAYGSNHKFLIFWNKKNKLEVLRPPHHVEMFPTVQSAVSDKHWRDYIKHKEKSLMEDIEEGEKVESKDDLLAQLHSKGLSYAKIGELMNMNKWTVRTSVDRAKR